MNLTELDVDLKTVLLTLAVEYDTLGNGDKAAIRKVAATNELLMNPAFYHLIQAVLNEFKDENRNKAQGVLQNLQQVARIVFFLPYVKIQGKSLGWLFKEQGISERRLFLMMRSEKPDDLIQLRRLCQQLREHKADAVNLGEMMYYWGDKKKQQLMKDYYLSSSLSAETETTDAGH